MPLQALTRANTDRILQCPGNMLQTLGIDNILYCASVLGVEDQPIIIGGGTDGISVIVAEEIGMKRKLQI